MTPPPSREPGLTPVTDAEAEEWPAHITMPRTDGKLDDREEFILALLADCTHDKQRVRKLEAGLRALHDSADDMNAEFAQPGRYCVLCRTDSYDAEEGVIHREGCVLRKTRALLEIPDGK